MIVVTDTGQVENCIYPKPAGASLDDLNIIAQRLTNYLAGMAMDHIDEKAIEPFTRPSSTTSNCTAWPSGPWDGPSTKTSSSTKAGPWSS